MKNNILILLTCIYIIAPLTIKKKIKRGPINPDYIIIFKCLDCTCQDHTKYTTYFNNSKAVNIPTKCNDDYKPIKPIEDQAYDMLNYIKKLKDATKKEILVDFYGFSIGGITARYIVQFYYHVLLDEGIKIHNLITFGSPHIGTTKAIKNQIVNKMITSIHNALSIFSDMINAGSQVLISKDSNFKYYSNKFLRNMNGITEKDNAYLKPSNLHEGFLNTFNKLNKIVLVRYLKDNIIEPNLSAWFLFEKDIYNSNSSDLAKEHQVILNNEIIDIHSLNEYNKSNKNKLKLSFEDNIGIKELFDSGKLSLVNVNKGHLKEENLKYGILPNLLNYKINVLKSQYSDSDYSEDNK